MGMLANILAIGPFSHDIADTLEYPAEFYASTRPGAPVIAYLFYGRMTGNTASSQFAAYLGITDPWDFNQHKVDPAWVDVDGLCSFLDGFYEDENSLRGDSQSFLRLWEKRFDFYFRPNG